MRRNAVYTAIGQIWLALVRLFSVPIFLKIIGFEQYSIILIFAMVQGLLLAFDYALSPTIIKEVGKYREKKISDRDFKSFIRSAEIFILFVSSIIFLSFFAFSNSIVNYFSVNLDGAVKMLPSIIYVIAAVSSLRVYESIYHVIFMGFERHDLLNSINIILHTARALGAILVLIFVNNTLMVFFAWQLFFSCVSIFLLACISYRTFIPAVKVDINIRPVVAYFAKGFQATFFGYVFFILFQQADKIFLFGKVSVVEIGFVVLAGAIGANLSAVAQPIANIFLPRIATSTALNDPSGRISVYSMSLEAFSIILFPIMFAAIFFSEQILLYWLGDASIANGTRFLLVFSFITNTSLCFVFIMNGTLFIIGLKKIFFATCCFFAGIFAILAESSFRYFDFFGPVVLLCVVVSMCALFLFLMTTIFLVGVSWWLVSLRSLVFPLFASSAPFLCFEWFNYHGLLLPGDSLFLIIILWFISFFISIIFSYEIRGRVLARLSLSGY